MGDHTSRQSRILLVDDDPEVIQILEANLAHANFEVISARNGAQALAKASRERPDLILLDVILPDLDGLDVCRRLKERRQTSHIPVIIISARVGSDDRIAGIAAGAEDYLTKPFDIGEVVSTVKASFKRIEQGNDVNPLTGLPNRTQINKEITALIEQNRLFAAIYVDMDSFRAFNNVYGFVRGDRAIQLLAEILSEALRLFGNPGDLVGHLGGDDFVVISTPQKARILCQRIITDFDARIRTLYDQRDLERGCVEYECRSGQRQQCPIMTLSAAVVTNEKRTFDSHLQLSETAAELRDYLRYFPGSNYYFDRRQNRNAALGPDAQGVPSVHRDELKAMRGMLAWGAFLTRELGAPITVIKDYLDSLRSNQVEGFDCQQLSSLEPIQESISQLLRIVAGLENLKMVEWGAEETALDMVDLRGTLEWVVEEVHRLAEQRGIQVDIQEVEDVSQPLLDGRSLTQGLFYLLRSEVESSAPGDRVLVRVSEASEAFISVEIINRNRYIPPDELSTLFRGEPERIVGSGQRNDLYLARVFVQGLGGKLEVNSQEGEGTVFTILVPKRWQSSVEQSNRLRSEVDTCSKAARDQLENIHYLLLSSAEQVPAAVVENLEGLYSKVQELEVLCNRSLLLADDLTGELESRDGQLMQREVEQLATSEALLVLSREIARLAQTAYLFDFESAQRVAKNALAIAAEFKLSRSEQRVLYHAALLKDIGLALAPQEMLGHGVASTPEKVGILSQCFNTVDRALSRLNFLAPALSFALHRYERYDGTGYPFGLSGDRIPLGAKILAVADAFDAMTSGASTQKTLDPETAVRELAADSGRRFDPQVVSVFLQAWRKKRLQPGSIVQV